ncbi:MAG: DUF1413 domain-containing protein [Clostridia bacterium]|nr:DUF1413 domain-containing protein [Clostridia bacterium]
MDYKNWMLRAIEIIDNEIKSGQRFEVKQLFPGHEWEALSRGERSNFGKLFSEAVREDRIPTIEKCGEGKTHHNQYTKK